MGAEQGAQALEGAGAGRELIAGGAGRADRGAGAAAGADRRVDVDDVAGGGDGAGGADVEAARAAGLAAARMGADLAAVLHVARLVELAEDRKSTRLNSSH